MNGATALDCENTIRRPNSTKTMTIGTSQYFFSCFRNCPNSEKTRLLLITASKHAFVVAGITIAGRVRRPARPLVAPPGQWILAGQTPDQGDRNEDDGEEDGQQDASVDVTQRLREPPPGCARVLQHRRMDETTGQ